MRPAGMLLGTAVALALAWPAHGESPPVPATVLTDGAEVRGKPGTEPTVYVTQKLPRGSAVQVVERLPNGWLKIEPPLPGSFSWVNTRYLQPDNAKGVWIVNSTDAPVTSLVGSWVIKDRPTVVGTTLARGTQLIAVSPPVHIEDGDWLRVQPPAGEYRYMLAKDVSLPPSGSSPVSPTTSARPGSTATTGSGDLPGLPPAGNGSLPAKSGDVHVGAPPSAGESLLDQAQKLERSGDKVGAAQLYDQLGRLYFSTNHDAAMQYYNRAAWLRGGTNPAPSAPATEADAVYLRARQAEATQNWPEAIRNYTRLGDLYRDDYKLSQQYYNRANWLKQRYPTPAAAAVPTTTTSGSGPKSTAVQKPSIEGKLPAAGPGVLARSPTPIDSQPTYVLQSVHGDTIAYLTAYRDVDLEHYVNRNVKVFGNWVQRTDVSGPYMRVAVVNPLGGSP
jgi:hypothetical protein